MKLVLCPKQELRDREDTWTRQTPYRNTLLIFRSVFLHVQLPQQVPGPNVAPFIILSLL